MGRVQQAVFYSIASKNPSVFPGGFLDLIFKKAEASFFEMASGLGSNQEELLRKPPLEGGLQATKPP
jgi:hypothetical protein